MASITALRSRAHEREALTPGGIKSRNPLRSLKTMRSFRTAHPSGIT